MYLHCCLYGVLYDMFDVTLYIVQIEYLRGIHSHIKLEVYISLSLVRSLWIYIVKSEGCAAKGLLAALRASACDYT